MLILIKALLKLHTQLYFIINRVISQLRFYTYDQMLYYSLCYYYEIKIRKSYNIQMLMNPANCSLLQTYYIINCCDN